MTETAAMKLPLNRAFALMSFHAKRHPVSPLELASDGYIAQEAARQQKL